MKKRIFIVLFFLCSVSLFSQVSFSIGGKAKQRIKPIAGSTIEIGTHITLKDYKTTLVIGQGYQGSPGNERQPRLVFVADCNGKDVLIDPEDAKNIIFDNPNSTDQLWQIISVNSDLYDNISSNGYQYDIRRDLEDETMDMLYNFQKSYGFFNDEYLDDYIQSLLHRIHPITLTDGRPGNLLIKILRSNNPNAFCTPTGTIIVTTGLLSTCRSEDELIGVLAHEVAHFVLDHQIININKARERKKRAEFWANFATTVAAASEIYVAAKRHVNLGGSLTYATAVLSTSIANSVLERLGAEFSREQEFEADAAATKVLEFMKKDPKALSAALSRIQTYCTLNGDYLALISSGTHPALSMRITQIGAVDPDQFNSKKYDQLVSFVSTFNAENEYWQGHLEAALELANRNIEAGVATEEDYLLKAIALRSLFDTPEYNQEALGLIIKAKALNVTPDDFPQIYKEEGITLMRLGRNQDAVNAFQTYLQRIDMGNEKPQYLLDEIAWTKKMIFKINAESPSSGAIH
jgi:Zn-dependent protease with chaperone function